MNMPATSAPGSRRCGYFSRAHRCVTYSQRGYPPSDVPDDPAHYSQNHFARRRHRGDGCAQDRQGACGRPLDGRRDRAACRHPLSGALPFGDGRRLRLRLERRSKKVEEARAASRETGKMFAEESMAVAAARYADAPMRQAQKNKDPRGYAEFSSMLSEHSAKGHALMMFNLQAKRPTLWEMEADLKTVRAAVAGDRRRRGRVVRRRQHVLEAHRADRRALRDPALRPHHHQRGAGRSSTPRWPS